MRHRACHTVHCLSGNDARHLLPFPPERLPISEDPASRPALGSRPGRLDRPRGLRLRQQHPIRPTRPSRHRLRGIRPTASTGTLNAEGSSAQKNAIEEAIAGFQRQCPDATVNYNPTGSGAGIKQFIAGQVDFAGSDSALKTEEKDGAIETDARQALCGSPAWNLPMVTGPIAIAYNVQGVDKLVLTPTVAAKIFHGKITTWNDPAIAAINPAPRSRRRRSRSSSAPTSRAPPRTSPSTSRPPRRDVWTAEPAKVWTGKGEGKEKSAGVAEGVKSTDGGITYVEWSYAKDNELSIAQVDNGGGPSS